MPVEPEKILSKDEKKTGTIRKRIHGSREIDKQRTPRTPCVLERTQGKTPPKPDAVMET